MALPILKAGNMGSAIFNLSGSLIYIWYSWDLKSSILKTPVSRQSDPFALKRLRLICIVP